MPDIESRPNFIFPAFRSRKLNCHIGKSTLRLNVGRAVIFPLFQRGQNLLLRVTALCCIPNHFPAYTQLLLRIQINFHIIVVAHGPRTVTKQTLHYNVGFRFNIFSSFKATIMMTVYRFDDGFAVA